MTRPCTDKTSFPYSCEAHGCTFDRISKVCHITYDMYCSTCIYLFHYRESAGVLVSSLMGVKSFCLNPVGPVFTMAKVSTVLFTVMKSIIHMYPGLDHLSIIELSKIDEVFGKTSRCFEYQSSLVGSGSSLACLNTSVVHHPNSGVTAYKIESGSQLHGI